MFQRLSGVAEHCIRVLDCFSASLMAHAVLGLLVDLPLAYAQYLALVKDFSWQSVADAQLAVLAVLIAHLSLANRRRAAERDPEDDAVA